MTQLRKMCVVSYQSLTVEVRKGGSFHSVIAFTLQYKVVTLRGITFQMTLPVCPCFCRLFSGLNDCNHHTLFLTLRSTSPVRTPDRGLTLSTLHFVLLPKIAFFEKSSKLGNSCLATARRARSMKITLLACSYLSIPRQILYVLLLGRPRFMYYLVPAAGCSIAQS